MAKVNTPNDEPAAALQQLADAGVLQAMSDLAVAAGTEIVRLMRQGFQARAKADQSPVTICDEAAEKIILAGLNARFAGIPVVAEEAAEAGFTPACGDVFFLVDPLDGTKEFIGGKPDFTVNVALVCQGAPVAGVVYAPASGLLWAGGDLGGARFAARSEVQPGAAAPPLCAMRPVRARPRPAQGMVALVSRSHPSPQVEAYLADLPIAGRRDMGSSLKFCLLAEGEADVYPRLSPTMEWDTAAGDAILRAAGGVTLDEAGQALRYGKCAENFRNPSFIAWGAPPG